MKERPLVRYHGGKWMLAPLFTTPPTTDAVDAARLLAQRDELVAALRIAVRQNSHDMLMTGEEIRLCQAAIAATKEQRP